jgi:hypothetical protein
VKLVEAHWVNLRAPQIRANRCARKPFWLLPCRVYTARNPCTPADALREGMTVEAVVCFVLEPLSTLSDEMCT